jgi:hypothetical protein
MPIVDIPFVTFPDERATNTEKNVHFINCFPEMVHAGKSDSGESYTRYRVRVRPGLSASGVDYPTDAMLTWRGEYSWEGYLYTVLGNKIYKGAANIGTMLSSTGDVYFTSTQGANKKLVISDMSNLYIVDTSNNVYLLAGGGTTYSDWAGTTAYSLGARRVPTTPNGFFYEVTTAGTSAGSEPAWPTTLGNTITDGTVSWTCTGYYTTLPTSHGPGLVFLDGYVTLMTADAEVYHSAVNDPLDWPALNVLTAEMEPDDGTRIIKHNNYLVAFGEWTYQVFYDAANPTASVYGTVQGANNFIGCPAPKSAVNIGIHLMWVGRDREGQLGVYLMEGLSPQQIAPTWVIRYLEDSDGSANVGNISASAVSMYGHQFYVLNIPAVDTTLAFDLTERIWVEFQSLVSGSPARFIYTSFLSLNGDMLAIDRTNQVVSKFSTSGLDVAATREVYILTDPWDGGIGAIKFMDAAEVVSDRPSASDTVTLYYSDDDWLTTSSDVRTFNLYSRSVPTRFGAFTRRSFKLKYTGTNDLRFESLRVSIRSSQRLVVGVK